MTPHHSEVSSPVNWLVAIRRWIGVETVLTALILIAVVVFSQTGRNFLSSGNFFEVMRLSVELGLIAMVITPVILTGGIDLSVGSLLGLCAVVFGKLWRDVGLPPGFAGLLTMVVGGLAGSLNGWMITQLRLPPLIVTLGTFSLFRGLAEALTGGVDNFTGFPDSFLYLGQGYIYGFIPVQLPIFVAVSAAVWIWVHKTAMGRGIRAMGYSPDAARYAGIPSARYEFRVYCVTGVVTALSALIYVAHVGQAKADAGAGYELLAITAVVLGGTSIFGGRGSVHGTLLGLLLLAVLKNGMTLSDQPSELVGIFTGILLLTVLAGEALMKRVFRIASN